MFLNLIQAIEVLSINYCPVIDQLEEGRLLTQDWHSSVLASASDLPFFFLPPVPTRLSISASNWSTWEESKQLYAYVQCVREQPECWGYRCTGSASPSCRSALVLRGPFELTPSDPAGCKDQAGKGFQTKGFELYRKPFKGANSSQWQYNPSYYGDLKPKNYTHFHSHINTSLL